MPYYRTCPECGAHLDPGERCDCNGRTPSAQLVTVQNGEPRTNSRIIAENMRNEHRAVKQLIKQYKDKFEQLGALDISNVESTGGRREHLYHLNEPQATFLLTLFKNNPVVVAFKLELVRQFYQMRQMLHGTPGPSMSPSPAIPPAESALYSLVERVERALARLETPTAPSITAICQYTPTPVQSIVEPPKTLLPVMRTRDKCIELLRQEEPGTGLTRFALNRFIRQGVIPHVRAGNKILVNYERLKEYLNTGVSQQPEQVDIADAVSGTIRRIEI